MNEQALNELLECSVCLGHLDDTSKVLPCQHTFCRQCLEDIVSTKHELRCPECRILVEIPVENLHNNILLIRLLEGLKTQARFSSSQGHKRAQAGSFGNCRSDKTTPQASYTNRPCAKAIFSYEGKVPGDLSFKKGEVVLLKKQIDENWYEGELNGQYGVFPAAFVQIIMPLSNNVPQCKGLFDFSMDGNEGDCLAFRKDELVTVIRKVDDNWLEGKRGDKIGIFPLSFVELNEPAKMLLRMTDRMSTSTSNTGPPVTPVHPGRSQIESCVLPGRKQTESCVITPVKPIAHHHLSNPANNSPSPVNALQRRALDKNAEIDYINTKSEFINTNSNGIVSNLPLNSLESSPAIASAEQIVSSIHSSNIELPVFGSPQHNVSTCTEPDELLVAVNPVTQKANPASLYHSKLQTKDSTSSSQSSTVFVALYNYTPQKPDEIELQKGEYYSVCEKCMDGWYKGKAQKTGLTGVFPGNYVKLVKSQHSSLNRPDSVSKSGTCPSGSNSQLIVSPPRPKTSSSQAVGRSRTKIEPEDRSASAESNGSPPPTVPRHPQSLCQAPTITASSSSPAFPSTSKATRHGQPEHSVSPVIGAKSESSSITNGSSPVWKHSLSTSANVTPPNVVVGATGNSALANMKVKEKKKEKEKMGLMKRLKGQKKSKTSDTETASSRDSSVIHSRSGSYPSDVSTLVHLEPSHKKSGSFDSSVIILQKPVRPKPMLHEKYQCVESYPAQSEIELDLKIGDIIFVHKKRDDGWYKGTLQRSGKTGLFPGSFAEKCH